MVKVAATRWSTVLGFDLAWFSSVFSEHLRIFSLHGAMSLVFSYILYLTLQWAELDGIGPWPGLLTIVVDCCDTVDWIIGSLNRHWNDLWRVESHVKPYCTIQHLCASAVSLYVLIWSISAETAKLEAVTLDGGICPQFFSSETTDRKP